MGIAISSALLSMEMGMGGQMMDGVLIPDFSGEHRMGTTIMAVRYDGDGGGVVMGADSRTSTGSYVANRVSDKITPVCNNVAVCRSGSAADTQALTEYVKLFLAQHSIELEADPEVKTAAHLFNKLNYQNKNALSAGIIVGGWDKYNRGTVWTIPLGGGLVEQPFSLGGSGSGYIYGYCDANYRQNMTRAECEEFVKNAVSLAMSLDGSSGGVIRLVTIHENGMDRQYVPGDALPEFWNG